MLRLGDGVTLQLEYFYVWKLRGLLNLKSVTGVVETAINVEGNSSEILKLKKRKEERKKRRRKSLNNRFSPPSIPITRNVAETRNLFLWGGVGGCHRENPRNLSMHER